ncbi:MAG TPA: hypothetical protein EYO61_04050 [Campylobacterales bacterium]|nr:hypothetical protein [Campylobacterales bacterium]HIO70806.1 hypothetical protein [Campylobacterales bacterium]
MRLEKIKRFLHFFSGIAWAILTFGSFFIFSFTIVNSSFFVAFFATFLVLFFFGLIVLFIEFFKLQIVQYEKYEELLKSSENRDNDKIVLSIKKV